MLRIPDWNELYPQLVISQTVPALYLGVHERGVFTKLNEWQLDRAQTTSSDSTTPDISAQRKEVGAKMMQLARLLEDVQELKITWGPGPAGSFSLLCDATVSLQAYNHWLSLVDVLVMASLLQWSGHRVVATARW